MKEIEEDLPKGFSKELVVIVIEEIK